MSQLPPGTALHVTTDIGGNRLSAETVQAASDITVPPGRIGMWVIQYYYDKHNGWPHFDWPLTYCFSLFIYWTSYVGQSGLCM